MALSDLFSRRRKEHAESEVGASDAPVHPTKVLARFIAGLSSRSQPVLLDLGPVVGTNVSFFGEELGCKIIVEDLSKDIDRHVRDGLLDQLPAFLLKRFPQESGSIDGILCWDVFDYLDKKSAQAAGRSTRSDASARRCAAGVFSARRSLNRAALLNTRATSWWTRPTCSTAHTPRHARKQRPLPNRDIQRLFEPLRIVEQFLLKTNLREVLFRKPPEMPGSAPVAPSA